MRYLVPLALPIAVAGCSGGAVDPQTWTCENLKPHIIEMSQTRRPRVLEINQVYNEMNSGGSIECIAQAEWAEGSGGITYGARISDGGSIILEYRQ